MDINLLEAKLDNNFLHIPDRTKNLIPGESWPALSNWFVDLGTWHIMNSTLEISVCENTHNPTGLRDECTGDLGKDWFINETRIINSGIEVTIEAENVGTTTAQCNVPISYSIRKTQGAIDDEITDCISVGRGEHNENFALNGKKQKYLLRIFANTQYENAQNEFEILSQVPE